MKKHVTRIIGLLLVLLLLSTMPLWAEEQLMTKIFFDKWLQQATTPLESQINNLQATLTALNNSVQEIRRQLSTEIKVTIGQKKALIDDSAVTLDVAPIIRNNRTMVPVRFIGEAFGAQFAWDESARKVTYTFDDVKIELFIDKSTAKLNGKSITLDAAPIIIGGRTMVPLRFVGEYMGATFDWDGDKQTATIYR